MLDLKQILVVSLEQAVAAPYCSNRLAHAGARVIKIEREEGDFARGYDSVVHGESAYFIWLNQGKESLAIDIKEEADAALLQRILTQADVFIQNLAPGAAARAGLASAALRAKYPKLICCDISGYGDQGAYRDMKAYDLLVQCESGMTSITGTPDAPGRIGVSACDITCGQQAYSAILEALIEREHSGEGCILKVSLFDSMAEWLAVPLLHYDYAGVQQRRVGINHATISPYGAYGCADGLASDARLKSNQRRVDNRDYVDHLINAVFCKLKRGEVIELLQQAEIAFGRLNDMAGLSIHPQLRRVTIDTPSGEAEVVAFAVSGSATGDLKKVPTIGEHSELIRKEFS